jgi:hypothetical protein
MSIGWDISASFEAPMAAPPDNSAAESIPVSATDLLDSGYAAALAAAPHAYYSRMADTLFAVAQAAAVEGTKRRSEALRLLARVCTMRLDPDDSAQPYKAGLISFVDERRSLIPDDLDIATIEAFARAASTITHPLLRARLADLVWLQHRPREIRFLQLAVDSYWEWVGTPALERWHQGQETCTARALQLAASAPGAAANRRDTIEHALLSAFDAAPDEGDYPAFWFADPLLRFRLGKGRRQDVAQRLERIGQACRQRGNLLAARANFGWAQRWYRAMDDKEAASRVLGAIAMCFEKEADAHTSGLVALNLYDSAIQIWRDMPRRQRIALDGEARIDALRTKLADSGRNAVDEELHTITTPPVDLSELIEATREDISGLETLDALAVFAGLYDGPDVEDLRSSAVQHLDSSVISRLFGSTTFSPDGRPVAKANAAVEGGESEQEAIARQLVQELLLELELVAHGQIRPALEVLRNEHNVLRSDWEALASESAIVPRDRTSLVAKGLHAGFQGDLVAALHLLTPQLEHMVRYHLKRAGAQTSTIDEQGIVMEKGLSSLVAMPEMARIFGNDLKFEIWALYCDKHGPNFRNDIAHGLVVEQQLCGKLGLYAWWMMCRLVLNEFWNVRRQSPEADQEELGADADADPSADSA